MLECFKATSVLFWRSNGDANPFRQPVPCHRSRDDSEFLHFSEDTLAVTHTNKNEVRSGWNKFESEFAKGTGEEFVAARIVATGFFNVGSVVEGSHSTGLDERVDVERLANFFESRDEFSMA